MGSNLLAVQQAVKIVSAAGAYAGAAKRLVQLNVVHTITGMVASGGTRVRPRAQVHCAVQRR